jgi:catechol 2,3-dioxygenase-like lactoylglutathione lyase family enzyme
MKRLHVHVSVDDLPASKRFYSTLFAAEPVVVKPDYAKWMLDDPRVNFAISKRGAAAGIEHLGIQVETEDELHDVYTRLQQAERPVLEEGAATCCYAKSEKSWTSDPQGIAWEAFLTSGESIHYGDDPARAVLGGDAGCCTPETLQGVCCPPKAELAPDASCCGPRASAAA